jgi:hypothetical protein
MAPRRCSDADLIELIPAVGVARAARIVGLTKRAVDFRRRAIEKKTGIALITPTRNGDAPRNPVQHDHRVEWKVENGVVLIGSDGHYWPGEVSTAHRAFVRFCKDLRPKGVIMNGDAFDGARVSRWPSIMWEKKPKVIEELEVVTERLSEIEKATPRGVPLAWPLGNHDARFENRLAAVAPEYEGIKGVHLKDHIGPRWTPCWSVWINDSVVVKHRIKGGVHATHNNAVASGKTTVTGHLHSAKVTPFDDYNGTRYGVDCGCLADPYGPQFLAYTEDNPRNHRSGFCVLTFKDGKLLQPELVLVWDEKHVQFRGALIRV